MLDEKTRKEYLFYVGRALRLAEKRYKQYSGDFMYDSIRNQLIYLYDVIKNKKEDETDTRVKIRTFTMAIYASREMENDKIFDDRIASACYIADEIINGLKNKKLPDDHEDNPNYYKRQEKLKKEYPDDYYV